MQSSWKLHSSLSSVSAVSPTPMLPVFWPKAQTSWFFVKNFNLGHFPSSLLYAALCLHCCIKLVACERSLCSFSDCLWYLPCIFFLPVIGFWFKDSYFCSCLQRKGFSQEMHYNCSVIFLLYSRHQVEYFPERAKWKNLMVAWIVNFCSVYYMFFPKVLGLDVAWVAKFRNICTTSRSIGGAWAALLACTWENSRMCRVSHPSEMDRHYLSKQDLFEYTMKMI